MRRLPALGLRGRIVAALVFTSAVVLAVAALRLLPPLEHQLRREEVTSLRNTAMASRATFEDLSLRQLHAGSRSLYHLARALERRTGARVLVFNRSGTLLTDTQPHRPGRFSDVPQALNRNRPVSGVHLRNSGAGEAHVALPMKIDGNSYALVLRKPLDDAKAAAQSVRRAFTVASLVGLTVALVLGIGIAATLVRRLRRLRDATLLLAEQGPETELAKDSSHDEVGDLARAFSTMQERLADQESVRRQFVATASHELRTPLAALRLMLELLEDDLRADPPDLDDARAQAGLARVHSERLAGLAADLLDLSRLDADVPLREEPVDLTELRRAVVAEFNDPRVAAAAPVDPCWASCDPSAVARIVRILVDNALRFSPAGEPVEVEVGREGDRAVVTVTDHGPGVPEAERERVFERFHRGSPDDGHPGFGLGLAIGRELAERMGGSLVLDPPRTGGARFVLRLPAADPLEARANEQVLLR
ncbi:MAG TPA: HAMP domain-containing sensor histidine kinase [Thermoleophilaceae bacterium]